MQILPLRIAICVTMRRLAIAGAFTAILSGCGSNPTTPPAPISAADQTLGLYARLAKENGVYTVKGICWSQPVNLPPGSSKYPRCPEPVNKEGAFYFNFTTLAVPGTSFAVCPIWGEYRPKPPPQCDEYKEIHEAEVTGNVVASPLIAIGAILSLGREVLSMVKLDYDAFRREIEKALPTPQRLAMIEEERAWRQGAPARAQVVVAQRRAQDESARLERQSRVQDFRAQVQQANRAAELQFQAAAAAPKTVGATVCSADNRLGFIEQISGSRIRLQVFGVAFARWTDALLNSNPLGPHQVDTSRVRSVLPSDPENEGLELPVTDRLYLFKPHPSVQIQPYLGSGNVLWDESRFWGTCGWMRSPADASR